MRFDTRVNLDDKRIDLAAVIIEVAVELLRDQRQIDIAPLRLLVFSKGAKDVGFANLNFIFVQSLDELVDAFFNINWELSHW